MKRDEWLAEFARGLGMEPPTGAEIKRLLDLAGTAAHASERTAAPIACWLAGRTDKGLDELAGLAESISPPLDDDDR